MMHSEMGSQYAVRVPALATDLKTSLTHVHWLHRSRAGSEPDCRGAAQEGLRRRNQLGHRTMAGLIAPPKRGRVGGRQRGSVLTVSRKAKALLASGQYTRAELRRRWRFTAHALARIGLKRKLVQWQTRIAAVALMRCTPDLLRLGLSTTTVCAWRIQLWKFEVVASSS